MKNDYIIRKIQSRIIQLETQLEILPTNSKKRKYTEELLDVNKRVLAVLMNKPEFYH